MLDIGGLPHRGTEDCEFVSPDTRRNFCRTGGGFEPARDLLQHAVADGMTVMVVDRLESIQIEHHQGV